MTSEWGSINLGNIFRPQEKVTGYILTYVYSPKIQWGVLRAGGSALKIWVNSNLVLANPAIRQGKFDQEHILVRLDQGWNKILVKSGILTDSWEVYLRMTEPDGNLIPGLKYSIDPQIISSYHQPDNLELTIKLDPTERRGYERSN